MSEQAETIAARCDRTEDLFALKGNARNQTRSIDWHSDTADLKRRCDRALLFGTVEHNRQPFTDVGRWDADREAFILDRLDSYECAIEMSVLMWAEIPVPL